MKSSIFICKKAVSLLCLIGIVVSIVFACPPAAKAAVSDSERVMVSMGDSYSSGEGMEDFYDQDLPTDKKVQSYDWLAHRSENSWAGQLYLSGKVMKKNRYVAENSNIGISEKDGTWYFVASSGATTDNITGTQRKYYYQTIDGKTSFSGYEDLPAQTDIFDTLDKKGQKADYVTLTLGGNDVGFTDIVKKAVLGSAYLNYGGLKKSLNEKIENFSIDTAPKLLKAYEAIRDKAGYQAKIIVAGYPKLFSLTDARSLNPITKISGAAISIGEAYLINNAVSTLNNKIDDLIKSIDPSEMQIYFVSVEDDFKGHEAYSNNSYINEICLPQAQDLLDLGTHSFEEENGKHTEQTYVSSYSVHPNKNGAKVYAKCVQDKIDELDGQNNRTSNEDRIPTTQEDTTAKVERPTTKPTTEQLTAESADKALKNKLSELTSEYGTASVETLTCDTDVTSNESWTQRKGIVSAKLADLDGNGINELVVARLIGGNLNSTSENLEIQVYDCTSEGVNLAGSVNVRTGNDFTLKDIDAFIYKIGKTNYIFVESIFPTVGVSRGIYSTYDVLEYGDGKLTKKLRLYEEIDTVNEGFTKWAEVTYDGNAESEKELFYSYYDTSKNGLVKRGEYKDSDDVVKDYFMNFGLNSPGDTFQSCSSTRFLNSDGTVKLFDYALNGTIPDYAPSTSTLTDYTGLNH